MFDSKIVSRYERDIVVNGISVLRCHIKDWKRDKEDRRFITVTNLDSGNDEVIMEGFGGIIRPILNYLNTGVMVYSILSIEDDLKSIRSKYWIEKPSIEGLDDRSESSTINLTQGKNCIVDAILVDWLMQWKWSAYRSGGGFYAGKDSDSSSQQRKRIPMHRFIVGARDGFDVDHKNGDGLDNRVCNLRECTSAENCRNSKTPKNNTSGYKGVNWNCDHKKWLARIMVDGKHVILGWFKTPLEGAIAYNEAAIKYHGEFARLNDLSNPPRSNPSAI